MPQTVEETQLLLDSADYLADQALSTSISLALTLERPLFLEGEAGVGKTDVAKVIARSLDRNLIRLQCYEGLDSASALYEWNYARQMVEIRIAEANGVTNALSDDIFSSRFLIERPLLQALRTVNGQAPVLLIDELDRADEPFEAFLLEVLSEYQVSIPELGVIKAEQKPIVVVTSNRTREVHDALKRRCFYHWIDYPDARRELAILQRKVTGAKKSLLGDAVAFVHALRRLELFKYPGVAETIDWTRALIQLEAESINQELVGDTLGILLKYQDDIEAIRGDKLADILSSISSISSISSKRI